MPYSMLITTPWNKVILYLLQDFKEGGRRSGVWIIEMKLQKNESERKEMKERVDEVFS